MNIKEYKNIVDKTAVFPNKVDKFGKAYCMLGLVGEFNEYLYAESFQDKVKEMGDVIWYVTALVRQLEINIDNVFPEMFDNDETILIPYDQSVKDVHIYTARLAEIIKKYYRDNTEMDKVYLENLLFNLMLSLYSIILIDKLKISNVLATNYNKLMKRKDKNLIHGSGDNREEQI